ILRRAEERGDCLVVAVSSDEFSRIKHKEAYYSYEDRKAILEAIKYLDEVIPELYRRQKVEDVEKHDIDVLVMGNDWEGECDLLKEYCEVVYLSGASGVATTKTKQELSRQHG